MGESKYAISQSNQALFSIEDEQCEPFNDRCRRCSERLVTEHNYWVDFVFPPEQIGSNHELYFKVVNGRIENCSGLENFEDCSFD